MAVQPPSLIALARAQQNWTQKQLADMLGCAVATISDVERGVYPLSPEKMCKWLDALKLKGQHRRAIALSVMPDAYVVEVGE